MHRYFIDIRSLSLFVSRLSLPHSMCLKGLITFSLHNSNSGRNLSI